jgi:HEAT repeat protein
MSVEYMEKWVDYLHGVDREMSRIACEKLAKLKDPAVVGELAKVLKNRPPEVRAAAVRALGTIGHRSAVPALVEALGDYEPIVSSAAADAIGEIGDASAVPALSRILKNYKEADRHHQIHGQARGLYMAAIHALERIGTREAKATIQKYHHW